eukprot:g4924.t1
MWAPRSSLRPSPLALSFAAITLLFFLASSPFTASAAASAASPTTRDSSSAQAAYEGWLTDRGVVVSDGLELRAAPEGGLGVFATRDLRKGETLVSMPTAKALMDLHRLRATDPIYASGILDAPDYCELDLQSVAMAHHLLEQDRLGAESPLYPMLRMLPRDLNLVAWSDEDLAVLEGSFAAELLERRAKTFHDFWRDVTRKTLGDWVTLPQFQWALSVVLSRSFDVDDSRHARKGAVGGGGGGGRGG